MKIMVTGGAGFIGSALIRYFISETPHSILNIDKLTYAADLNALASISEHPRYHFEKADICYKDQLTAIFNSFKPDVVMHLAAETHVDRSIAEASNFIMTNIFGTYTLLEATRKYWTNLSSDKKNSFKFHHISTDEVYGDLNNSSDFFTEQTAYAPSSPYSASKASSDHLVRAWHRTYGLPILISHCSNNYGPFQHPEKLVPLIIMKALKGNSLPIYGDGEQIRDWLFVEDHVRALHRIIEMGRIGETYDIGGLEQKTNLEVVKSICEILETFNLPKPSGIKYYSDLITHVPDRAGHDRRYAINPNKIRKELGWQPQENFATGIRKTIHWYLNLEKAIEPCYEC